MTQALSADLLRWRVDPDQLDFQSTANVEPEVNVVGQPLAAEALQFGLDTHAPGQNIFVRGIRGTGRLTMVLRVLDQLKPRSENILDRCYVHNFSQPDQPRLISLPQGQARPLRTALRELAEYVAGDLAEAMNSRHLQAARTTMQEEAQAEVNQITQPFEEELKAENLALVQLQTPQGNQAAIFPVVDGQPVPLEQYEGLVRSGQVEAADRDKVMAVIERFARRLPELTQSVSKILRESSRKISDFNERNVRRILSAMTDPVSQQFDSPALTVFLSQLIDDVVEKLLHGTEKGYDPLQRYGINILLEHTSEFSPVVQENSPSLSNLLGTIERQWKGNQPTSDYRGIRGGSLLAADGGYLILDAHDVLAEPGAWQILMRTLRTGVLEIVPREYNSPFAPVSVKPEPIPIDLRVVLIGNARLYYRLDALDYDFSDQFKVLADFSDTLERSPEALQIYAGVLAHIGREEGLRHFAADAVAALAEHGARVADRAGKLTARFGRIADLAREANWVAGQAHAELISGDHVREAVARTKRRASLPSRRFQSLLKDGTVHIQTGGSKVGQVNGLAVMSAGPVKYGFPARITAAIGAGNAGIIDIEGSSAMSGSIHTKGFHILGGLLRHLLHADHPLAFSASIAFEQSYGGIDGDSASGAEICCLLSALTGVPLRQDLAMTGAIDQHGRIQAIGGVNEKIEGFFDICDHFGLSGSQGVIIPQSNAGDLMLRQQVVDAAAAGRFAVYPVATVGDALELFTGMPAGQWSDDGYAPDSLLGIARRRAREFWEETARRPDREENIGD